MISSYQSYYSDQLPQLQMQKMNLAESAGNAVIAREMAKDNQQLTALLYGNAFGNGMGDSFGYNDGNPFGLPLNDPYAGMNSLFQMQNRTPYGPETNFMDPLLMDIFQRERGLDQQIVHSNAMAMAENAMNQNIPGQTSKWAKTFNVMG